MDPDRLGEYAVCFRGAGHEGIFTFGDLYIFLAGVVVFYNNIVPYVKGCPFI